MCHYGGVHNLVVFQSKIVKGNTFDLFPPFSHCLAQKRTFESGRYFHLTSQASDPVLASKTLLSKGNRYTNGNFVERWLLYNG